MANMNPMTSLHKETRQRVYETLRDRVIQAIEKNEDLRWDSLLSRVDAFINIATGRAYMGWTNNLLLAFTSMVCNGDPRFLTFNQVKKISGGKGFVIKGSKMTPIFVPIFKEFIREDEEGEEKKISTLVNFRTCWVANVDQTNLVEIGVVPEEWFEPNRDPAPLSVVEDFVSAIQFKQVMTSTHPFYNPTKDEIGMPAFEQFQTVFKYSESLVHELIHWTGHSSRLDRGFDDWENIQEYSQEELVACLGSSFLLAHLGVEMGDDEIRNTSAYIKGWLKPLNNDIEMLVTAAIEASRAANYLIKLSREDQIYEAA